MEIHVRQEFVTIILWLYHALRVLVAIISTLQHAKVVLDVHQVNAPNQVLPSDASVHKIVIIQSTL